jgi:hypothetical protein
LETAIERATAGLQVTTIAAAAGLPVEEIVISPEGRPFKIADKGTPVKQLLA